MSSTPACLLAKVVVSFTAGQYSAGKENSLGKSFNKHVELRSFFKCVEGFKSLPLVHSLPFLECPQNLQGSQCSCLKVDLSKLLSPSDHCHSLDTLRVHPPTPRCLIQAQGREAGMCELAAMGRRRGDPFQVEHLLFILGFCPAQECAEEDRLFIPMPECFWGLHDRNQNAALPVGN